MQRFEEIRGHLDILACCLTAVETHELTGCMVTQKDRMQCLADRNKNRGMC